MSERVDVLERVQVGLEVTPGTKVAATKRIRSFDVVPTPNVSADLHRPPGTKFPTLSRPGADHVTASLSGIPTYSELVYLLSSLIKPATITTPGGATDAREWLFTATPEAEHAPQTYTVEKGQSLRAGRFGFGLVNTLDLGFPSGSSPGQPSISGQMIGGAYEDGFTLTSAGSVAEIAQVPIFRDHFALYLDAADGDLGTTPIARNLNATLKWPAQRSPLFLNNATTGWGVAVEGEGTAPMIDVTLAADSAGMARLADIRAGTIQYLRLEATGAEIDTGVNNYQFRFDAAVLVEGFSEIGKDGGLSVVKPTWRVIDEYATWGKAYEVTVVNELAAL